MTHHIHKIGSCLRYHIVEFQAALPLLLGGLLLVSLIGCKSAPILPPSALPAIAPTTSPPEALWHIGLSDAQESALQPKRVGQFIYAASPDGALMKLDASGQIIWRVDLKVKVTAGVGADENSVSIATQNGTLMVFEAQDGRLRWKKKVSAEWLGPPLVLSHYIIARTNGGFYYGWDTRTGRQLWLISRPIGRLAVRSHHPMLALKDAVIIGGPQGTLFALLPENGRVVWEARIAQARGVSEVERLVDIVSVPVAEPGNRGVRNNRICAASFQGSTACVDATNGKLLWKAHFGSVAGLAVIDNQLIVIDRKDAVYALKLDDGQQLWSNTQLFNRKLAPPVATSKHIVFGDGLGFVFWLDPKNGQIVAALPTKNAIQNVEKIKHNPRYIATLPVVLNDQIIIQSRLNGLFAFR